MSLESIIASNVNTPAKGAAFIVGGLVIGKGLQWTIAPGVGNLIVGYTAWKGSEIASKALPGTITQKIAEVAGKTVGASFMISGGLELAAVGGSYIDQFTNYAFGKSFGLETYLNVAKTWVETTALKSFPWYVPLPNITVQRVAAGALAAGSAISEKGIRGTIKDYRARRATAAGTGGSSSSSRGGYMFPLAVTAAGMIAGYFALDAIGEEISKQITSNLTYAENPKSVIFGRWLHHAKEEIAIFAVSAGSHVASHYIKNPYAKLTTKAAAAAGYGYVAYQAGFHKLMSGMSALSQAVISGAIGAGVVGYLDFGKTVLRKPSNASRV